MIHHCALELKQWIANWSASSKPVKFAYLLNVFLSSVHLPLDSLISNKAHTGITPPLFMDRHMSILTNADVSKWTWLFILKLKFPLPKILLARVCLMALHPKKEKSRGKQLDRRHRANVPPQDYRLSNMSRTQSWKRWESELFKGLSRSRGMLLFLRKPCWHARWATVDNIRSELQQEGGQVTSE